jgi:hypothetical protein
MGGVSPVLYRLLLPARHAKILYTRMSKLLAAAHIFTNSFENSKILSWLLSVLSLSRKFVHDHCCCPKSAIILKASKLDPILDFWRGYRKSVPNDMGGGLSLSPLILISWPQAVRQTLNVGKGGGGGGEKGGEKGCLAADNSP